MIGVMFVGLFGVNATTMIAGCRAMVRNIIPTQYGITGDTELLKNNFVDIEKITFSGWDYYNSNVYECAKKHNMIPDDILEMEPELKEIKAFKGVHTSMDIPIEDSFDHFLEPDTVESAIQVICHDIDDFKENKYIEDVIVIYMGSPGKMVDSKLLNKSYEQIVKMSADSFPGALLYAIAAIESGTHFVDFTPSQTLEFKVVYDLANKYQVQVSGRDGSTGQTMLKLTIAEMLKIRNLHLNAWYSTNIIGNHDGYVLSMPDYRNTKIQDKMNGIAQLLGYDDFEHKVTIDYFKYKGDSKESWDAVYFSGWMNTKMSLKMNWQGEDAFLAAPIILDIIRFIELGIRNNLYGFQKQLGLFYKHPFLCEGMSFTQLYEMLIEFYRNL